MSIPRRIQMSRQHPWRKENPDAVIVARPSKWGNDWRVSHAASGPWVVWSTRTGETRSMHATKREAAEAAVEYHRADVVGVDVGELRGRDVACWCAVTDPCHGDTLLELAGSILKEAS